MQAFFVTNLLKYRLLAFVVCHKARRRNSCIYGHEKKYILAKELGISVNTYSKYLSECLRLQLCRRSGEGYVFNGLKFAITALFGDCLSDYKYVRFFRGIDQKKDFNTILERIKFAVAECNFKRQQYRIKEITDVVEWLNRPNKENKYNKAKRIASKLGCSISEITRISKKLSLYIKTGKKHLSNLLGCCTASATRYLHKWDGVFIKRTNIFKSFDIVINEETFQIMNNTFNHVKVIGNKFKIDIGSKVTILFK